MPILGGGLDITVEVRSPHCPWHLVQLEFQLIGRPLFEDEECMPPRRVAD